MKMSALRTKLVGWVGVKRRDLRAWAASLPENRRADQLAREYRLPTGHRRIFFYHVRKTAGTSLNQSFIALAGGDPRADYERLANHRSGRIIRGDKVIVGFNRYLIQRGRYFYGFAHAPWWDINIPPGSFTITCLRDPVQRVISHYRMLRTYERQHPGHRVFRKEGQMLGEGLGEFVARLPKKKLMNQLYMFSERYDPEEAAERALSCDFVFFTERFDDALERLGRQLALPLKPQRANVSTESVEPEERAVERLAEILEPERRFIERVAGQIGAERSVSPATVE